MSARPVAAGATACGHCDAYVRLAQVTWTRTHREDCLQDPESDSLPGFFVLNAMPSDHHKPQFKQIHADKILQ